uniref:Oxidative stress-responsive serine-rich protein 1 n=1 Tax=Panagrellus redivivus TaxID=6233 RepID=A0A7E4VCL7_PANRE
MLTTRGSTEVSGVVIKLSSRTIPNSPVHVIPIPSLRIIKKVLAQIWTNNLWHAAAMNAESFSAAVNFGEQQIQHDLADSVELSTQFEQLNLRNETPVATVSPVSEVSTSNSHDGPKKLRFRPKADCQPRKSLDSTAAIRKRSYLMVKNALRPRAMSLNNCSQIRSGRFGAVCRKMFMQRRRRSFSETSSKSEDEPETEAPQQPEPTPEASQSPSDPNNVQSSCGQEASTTADFEYSIESGEVDELAEYFGHFVNVRLKMSNMAESMYV